MRQSPVRFNFVIRMEHAALHLVRRETEPPFHLRCKRNQLLGSANLSLASRRIRISPEAVRRKSDTFAQTPAQNLTHRHAPRLPQDIETRKLQRRQCLRAVVI